MAFSHENIVVCMAVGLAKANPSAKNKSWRHIHVTSFLCKLQLRPTRLCMQQNDSLNMIYTFM